MSHPASKFSVGQKVRSSGAYPNSQVIEGLVGTVVSFKPYVFNEDAPYPYLINWGEPIPHYYLHSENELEAAE